MKTSPARVKIFFPKISDASWGGKRFVDFLVKEMTKNKSIRYAGYRKVIDLRRDLLRYLGRNNAGIPYMPIPAPGKKKIKKTISLAVAKSHKLLPHPDLPIFVFIYPWLPDKDTAISFGGVTGFTTYYTAHLFIDMRNYDQRSLTQTIVHEWNHLVFYRHHPEGNYTLKTHMIMEGLAEIFTEEVTGGKPSPWAVALSEKEIKKQFAALKEKLNKRSIALYRNVFFGNREYRRWTGYAIGYKLAKSYRQKNPKVSWEKIITTEAGRIGGPLKTKRV